MYVHTYNVIQEYVYGKRELLRDEYSTQSVAVPYLSLKIP